MTESHGNNEAEQRELMQAIQICLSSADRLGLGMVAIYLSSAIDCLSAEIERKDYQARSTVQKN